MVWQDGVWRKACPTIEDLSDNFRLVRDERIIEKFIREADRRAGSCERRGMEGGRTEARQIQVEETVLQVSFNLLARCCPFGVSFHCKPVLAFSFTLADGPGVGGVSSDLPGCSPSS